MKVLVTGATGFTGSYVIPLLLQQGVEVHCFVRKQSVLETLPMKAVQLHYGDLDEPSSLTQALQGKDVLINIASLGFGHAANIITAAQKAQVSRAIFISTTAIFTKLNAPSKAVRLAAEAAIIHSGLEYTILRPTMIYGSSRDRNMCRLIRYLKRWPAIPIIGSGTYLQQPIYVGDLAKAVTQTIFSSSTIGKGYNIAGADKLTYNQVIDTINTLLNRKVIKIHIPYRPIVNVFHRLESLRVPLPVKAEQILRLNEDKAFDSCAAREDFSYQSCTFSQGICLEIAQMSEALVLK